MRALVVAGSFLLIACEGQVGELGDQGGSNTVVIRDRSGPEVVSFTCAASTVATREALTCSVEARHPTQEALRCTLEVEGPSTSLAANGVLGDCTTVRSTSLRFSSPGVAHLTLNVLDAQDRAATRTITVQVTGLPNQPPEVVGLTASRTSGVAPLQTTLSWTSTDPEGDAVSCALDVGADGTIDEPVVDCATWTLALRTVGAIPVKVIATDSGGLTSDRTVTITVAPPTADLRIASVEFGQTVMKAGLELVKDKPALLRVTVLANEGAMATVVEVEAKQGSTVLGTQRLTGPAVVPLTATPADLSKSFRFMMPRAWVVEGLTLSIKVDPEDATLEADETNNAQVLSPMMGRDNVLHLTAVPIAIGAQTGQPLELNDTITALWPVKSVDQQSRAPYTFTGTLSSTSTQGWAQLLGELAQVQGADGSSRAYYGFIPGGGGGIAGLGYVGQHVAIGLDGYATVAAHELGHNFGINHAPCGGAAGADPSYPYPNAQLGSWGFNGSQLLSPTSHVDVMSYCSSVWVSDYNYEKAQQHMEGRRTFDPTAVLPAIIPEDSVLISGRLTSNGATLSPVYRVNAVPTAQVDSDTRLRIATVEGRHLEVPVTLLRPAEGDELHFFAVIPWPGELTRVSVSRAGVVLASRDGSSPLDARAQVQRVDANTIRVAWPGGATATIAHLGAVRTTLTIGASGGTALLRTDGLEGGQVEVSLSTGLKTTRTLLPLPL
ncbi:MAG: M66 family metalloprotease [Archangium sp.]|nr:M66 family metalloprotease [Archangium sp.]